MHLIDLWTTPEGSGDKDGNNFRIIYDMETPYRQLQRKYESSKIVKIHRGDSLSVLDKFPDNYFDVVYIDSNHSYEHTYKELELSKRKVKNRGYILGHDFYEFFPGVVFAVIDFCKKYKYVIEFMTNDVCATYYIRNNKYDR